MKMKLPFFYLATILLFIHTTSPQPMLCTLGINRSSSQVWLNLLHTTKKICMDHDVPILRIGLVSEKCKWTAWQVGTEQLYIFGQQRYGKWYFMTLHNNSSFVVEEGADPKNKVLCDDSRLFEYTFSPLTHNNYLRHKASGYYFTEPMTVDETSNLDRAMCIVMEWIEA